MTRARERRDQAGERGGRHESREKVSDMTGQAGSGAGGAQKGREVRIIPPIIVCSRSGS